MVPIPATSNYLDSTMHLRYQKQGVSVLSFSNQHFHNLRKGNAYSFLINGQLMRTFTVDNSKFSFWWLPPFCKSLKYRSEKLSTEAPCCWVSQMYGEFYIIQGGPELTQTIQNLTFIYQNFDNLIIEIIKLNRCK